MSVDAEEQERRQGQQEVQAPAEDVQQHEELRCVVAVLRHGDRQPKQKMKFKVWHPLFLEFFRNYAEGPHKEVKLKQVVELTALLDLVKMLLHRYSSSAYSTPADAATWAAAVAIAASVAASVSASVAEAAAAKGEDWKKKAGIAMREDMEQEFLAATPNAQGAWMKGPPQSLNLNPTNSADHKYAERYGIAAASAAASAFKGGASRDACVRAAAEAASFTGARDEAAAKAAVASVASIITGAGLAAAASVAMMAVTESNGSSDDDAEEMAKKAAAAANGGATAVEIPGAAVATPGSSEALAVAIGGVLQNTESSPLMTSLGLADYNPSQATTPAAAGTDGAGVPGLDHHMLDEWEPDSNAIAAAAAGKAAAELWAEEGGASLDKLAQMREVLERWRFSGINRKVQLKPCKWATKRQTVTRMGDDGVEEEVEEEVEEVQQIQLVVKWGGDLTQAGRQQAEALGIELRNTLYPSGGRGSEGGGLLRLHSTFRHDLKLYTSDEGRVQMTAAAFAKGFLELEGELTPLLVSLVQRSKMASLMLDHSGHTSARKMMDTVKQKLKVMMTLPADGSGSDSGSGGSGGGGGDRVATVKQSEDISTEPMSPGREAREKYNGLLELLTPNCTPSIERGIKAIYKYGHPYFALMRLRALVQEVVQVLKQKLQEMWLSDSVDSMATVVQPGSPLSPLARLTALYTLHNPSKLDGVEATLAKYAGREDELFAKLDAKYGSALSITPVPTVRARLTALYKAHAPTKLGKVEGTLAEYNGREDELFAKLCNKYDIPPDSAGQYTGDTGAAASASGGSSSGSPTSPSHSLDRLDTASLSYAAIVHSGNAAIELEGRPKSPPQKRDPSRERPKQQNPSSPPSGSAIPARLMRSGSSSSDISEIQATGEYGVQWCAVVCSGVQWCAVVCSGVQWCAVVCSGVQWCAVV
jgi:hypothetical protein